MDKSFQKKLLKFQSTYLRNERGATRQCYLKARLPRFHFQVSICPSSQAFLFAIFFFFFLPKGKVELVVKNPSANAGNERHSGSVLGLEKFPGEGNGNLL